MSSLLNQLEIPYSAVYITVCFVLLMNILSVVLKTRFGRLTYALWMNSRKSVNITVTQYHNYAKFLWQ